MDNKLIKIGFYNNNCNQLTQKQKEQIEMIFDKYNNISVVHSDCLGSDTDFHNLCENYKETHPEKTIKIYAFPPNNPTLRAFNKGVIVMAEKPHSEIYFNIIKHSSLLICCSSSN